MAVGQTIWRFTPGFDLEVDAHELQRLAPVQREYLLHYGYVDRELGRFILCCDDARFINHSATPNIAGDRSTDVLGIDVAVREIAVGEEITIDYGSIENAADLLGAP